MKSSLSSIKNNEVKSDIDSNRLRILSIVVCSTLITSIFINSFSLTAFALPIQAHSNVRPLMVEGTLDDEGNPEVPSDFKPSPTPSPSPTPTPTPKPSLTPKPTPTPIVPYIPPPPRLPQGVGACPAHSIPVCIIATQVWGRYSYSYGPYNHTELVRQNNGTMWYMHLSPALAGVYGNERVCACSRLVGGGCFPPGVNITLSNGHLKKVEAIRPGDQLLNPVTGKSLTVQRIIEGLESDPIIEFGFETTLVRVSQKHPVLTQGGIKKAQELNVNDLVMGQDGSFHKLSSLKELPVYEGQYVINFDLVEESLNAEDHLLLSDGIVTGDLFLQTHPEYFVSQTLSELSAELSK